MRPEEHRELVRSFLAGDSGLTAKALREKGLPVCGRSNAVPTIKHVRKDKQAKGEKQI